MVGKLGLYHADLLSARFGVMKAGDLYQQQVRMHGWKFWKATKGSGGYAPVTRDQARLWDLNCYGQ